MSDKEIHIQISRKELETWICFMGEGTSRAVVRGMLSMVNMDEVEMGVGGWKINLEWK